MPKIVKILLVSALCAALSSCAFLQASSSQAFGIRLLRGGTITDMFGNTRFIVQPEQGRDASLIGFPIQIYSTEKTTTEMKSKRYRITAHIPGSEYSATLQPIELDGPPVRVIITRPFQHQSQKKSPERLQGIVQVQSEDYSVVVQRSLEVEVR